MISIIIPLYNKQNFIQQTLKSVLSQSISVFEIIVIDDGSTDNSASIVKSLSDTRIRLIKKPNEGVSVARNRGIKEANFDWIAFLDADDWWAQDYITEFVVALDRFPNEKIFGMGRSRVFGDQIKPYANNLLPNVGELGRINYLEMIANHLPPINSSNVIIHKSLLTKQKFREGMTQHEDHDLWVRLCKNQEIVYINKPLSFYRKEVSDSSSMQSFRFKDFNRYLQDLNEVMKSITPLEQQCLKEYCSSFIPIRYIQSYTGYTTSERKKIREQAKGLVRKSTNRVLRIMDVFVWLKPYQLYKTITG